MKHHNHEHPPRLSQTRREFIENQAGYNKEHKFGERQPNLNLNQPQVASMSTQAPSCTVNKENIKNEAPDALHSN